MPWSQPPNDQIQIVDQSTGDVAIQIGPGPEITLSGAGLLELIGDPPDGRFIELVLNATEGTPGLILGGRGTFPTRKIVVMNMDDQNDQTFRLFMGVSDDVRAIQDQWDLAATVNSIIVHGYAPDFFTPTNGFIYDPTQGAILVSFAGTTETWHDVTLMNGWANRVGFNHLSYRIDVTGRVWLRGSISGGTSVSGTQIGSVPAGYRPTSENIAPIASDNLPGAYAPATARCRVLSTGEMFIYTTGAGPLYFDGYSYSVL